MSTRPKPRITSALSILLLLIFAVACLGAPARAEAATQNMYRMYNSGSAEHLYTSSQREVGTLLVNGWSYEGVGWVAPTSSNTPVYRAFNKYSGEHLYTTSANEKNSLVANGWADEGVAWYSDDAKAASVWRLYNKRSGRHNYTGSSSERQSLLKSGWVDEGVAWYATSVPAAQTLPKHSKATAASVGIAVVENSQLLYRLYNSGSKEHLYTKDLNELGNLVIRNWTYEGPAWLSPASSSVPVYRVFNPKSGEHLYTTQANEKNTLVQRGWNDEGICWYSDTGKTAPIYREYHRPSGAHNYTGGANEHKVLTTERGWTDEGTAWYALAVPKESAASSSNYARVDKSAGKIYLYNASNALVSTVSGFQITGNYNGTYEVYIKARGYWKEPDCYDVNDWYVGLVQDWWQSPSSSHMRYVEGMGYDEGAGFHYGFSGSGCIVINNKDNAKQVYDFLSVGSKVYFY